MLANTYSKLEYLSVDGFKYCFPEENNPNRYFIGILLKYGFTLKFLILIILITTI